MKQIEIKCSAKDYLEIGDLTEFQGNLKLRDNEDFNKITRSILKHGFCFPFFVWKKDDINYVLDGHGRLGAMQRLDELGYKIPSLPVVYVDCKNERAAKDLLLRLNSFYGRMTKESVLEFTEELDIDFSDLALPTLSMNLENLELPDIIEENNNGVDETMNILVKCNNSDERDKIFKQLQAFGLNCEKL